MAPTIDLETAFWITIDISLALLITFILTKYFKLRGAVREAEYKTSDRLMDFSMRFKEYILNFGGRKAIITIFNELIDNLAASNHIELKKSLTNREVLTILSSNLSRDASRLLHEMYGVYELARFGGYEPGGEEVERFSEMIELLIRTVNSSVGE